MATPDLRPTCFIAMPITTHEESLERFGGDEHHWTHVIESIFVPAVEAAGFRAVRPSVRGTDLIHGEIIRQLSTADMVLCDLSDHNPNVFFELGVRTSLNKPIALVRDEHTKIPFDTSNLNTYLYKSSLNAWDTADEVEGLKTHLADSVATCKGENPLWRHFGLTITASQPEVTESATDAKIELIWETLRDIRLSLPSGQRKVPTSRAAELQLQRIRALIIDLSDALGGERPYKYSINTEGYDLRVTFENESVSDSKLAQLTDVAAGHAFELVSLLLDDRDVILNFEDHDPIF